MFESKMAQDHLKRDSDYEKWSGQVVDRVKDIYKYTYIHIDERILRQTFVFFGIKCTYLFTYLKYKLNLHAGLC